MTVAEVLAHLAQHPYLTVQVYRSGQPCLLAAWKEVEPGRWRLEWLEKHPERDDVAPWLLTTGVLAADEFFADLHA